MSQLLHRPLRAFAVYSLVVLACSIPAYYLIVDDIWQKELDEHNHNLAIRTEKGLNEMAPDDAEIGEIISLWNHVQPGTFLRPAQTREVRPDSMYTITRPELENPDETDRFRCLSTYIHIHGQPYELIVETNIEESNETFTAIAVITLLFFVLLVGGFLFINRRISRQIWRPFRRTLDQLRSFDLNHHHPVQFEPTGIREFAELHDTLKKLIDRNISVFRQQKEFTENVSHELQTPLALIKSQLDLLLQDPSLSRRQSERIESLHRSFSRLSRINQNLLLLAKIENGQFPLYEPVDMPEILAHSLEFLEEHITGKQITVQAEITPHVIVTGNKSLAEILVSNLLLNAIRHNIPSGTLSITLQKHILIIANTGEAPLQQENLFRRFMTASVHTPGSGLGLSIIRQICHVHQWEVGYDFRDGMHIFSVRF